MNYKGIMLWGLVVIFLITLNVSGQRRDKWREGDELQLQTYIVESITAKPDVTDGWITAPTDRDEWQAASARQITCIGSGGVTRIPTLFFSNSEDSLYISSSFTK